MTSEVGETRELRLDTHRRMLTLRYFEERLAALLDEGLVRGAAHSYIGMEAVAVGTCQALGQQDWITSTHRGHGHCLAKGLEPGPMFAELLGREGGYCGGKGGSMHITATAHRMLGADGIVGGSTGIAVGAAFGERLAGSDAIVACFLGDGAINQGLFHESANLAAVLRLGVVFVCENNRWALSTPTSAAHPVPTMSERVAGYGFPGVTVDGNDPDAVRRAVSEAVERARRGDGPSLVEAQTYRLTPHSAFSSTDARNVDELSQQWDQEPIARHRRQMLAERIPSEEIDALELEVRDEIAAAARDAAAQPPVNAAVADHDVYAPAAWNMHTKA